MKQLIWLRQDSSRIPKKNQPIARAMRLIPPILNIFCILSSGQPLNSKLFADPIKQLEFPIKNLLVGGVWESKGKHNMFSMCSSDR